MSPRIRPLPSKQKCFQRLRHGLLRMKARLSVDTLLQREPGHRKILVSELEPQRRLIGIHGYS